jgi:hypothetical protein
VPSPFYRDFDQNGFGGFKVI